MMKVTRMISLLGLLWITASCSHPEAPQAANPTAPAADTVLPASASCDVLLRQARKLDSLLLVSNDLNKPLAAQAIDAFDAYASNCKNDTLAPVFLIKGAQVAQSVLNIQKAQAMLQKCIDGFPAFKNRGAAMFLLAELYDEHSMLNNEAEAKKLYEQIIKEYPNTDWERNARSAIANLGKSDEDLVKEFMKKNKHS